MANSSRDNKTLQAGRSAAATPRSVVSRPQAAPRPAGNGEEKLYVELPVLLEALGRLQQKRKKRAADLRATGNTAAASAPQTMSDNLSALFQTTEETPNILRTNKPAPAAAAPLFAAHEEPEQEDQTAVAEPQSSRPKRVLIRPAATSSGISSSEATSPNQTWRKVREFLMLAVALAAVLGVCVHFGIIKIGNGDVNQLTSQFRGAAAAVIDKAASAVKDTPPAKEPTKENSKPVADIKVPVTGRGNAKEMQPAAPERASAITGVAPANTMDRPTAYASTVNGIRYPDTNREPVVLESQNGLPVSSARPGREDPFNYDIIEQKAPALPIESRPAATPKVLAAPYAFSCELKLLAIKSSTGTPSIAVISHTPGDKTFYVKRGDTFTFNDKNNESHELTVIDIGSNGVTVTYGEGAKQTLVIN